MVFKVNGNMDNNNYGLNNTQINPEAICAKIDTLSKSIPDVTTNRSQKENAIRVKKEIIKLKQILLQDAKNKGDTMASGALYSEINTIQNEIKTIQDEIDGMESIFNQ